jgi:hypothetical protein
MKMCPSCYAIMKETTRPAQVPKMQLKPSEIGSEVPAVKVRYECTQCGHMEEAFAKPVLA